MFSLTWPRVVCVCILAAASSSIYAVDGVILIDQSHALAGNITPGDTPGFPVTISQPGSYRLSGNLTLPDANTSGIIITGDYVTLDLNGFSISGPVVCTSSPAVCPVETAAVGIQSFVPQGQHPSPRATKVFNGVVRGTGGVAILMTGQGASVERVRTDSNAGPGIVVGGSVIDCSATMNGGFGILAITVRGSTSTDNHNEGIILDASGGVGTGNIASFNGKHGILAPNAAVIGNTMVRNTLFGLSATCPSSIIGNTIVSNTGGSIQTNGAGCVLTDNATRP